MQCDTTDVVVHTIANYHLNGIVSLPFADDVHEVLQEPLQPPLQISEHESHLPEYLQLPLHPVHILRHVLRHVLLQV